MDMAKYQQRQLFLANSLAECIEESDLRGLDSLLRNYDVDPNFIMPEKQFSAMHVVAAVDNESFAVKALKLLLEHGADPNVCGEDSITPVHVAASWDHANIFHVLLENGGDPLLKDEEGKDAYDYVQANGSINTKQVLALFHSDDKLFLRLRRLQSSLPYNVSSRGRRSRMFFRPSVLARIPDSPIADSSSDDSIQIIEVCQTSESLAHASQPLSPVCVTHNKERDDSVVSVEEVSSLPQSLEECFVIGASVAGHSQKPFGTVDDDKKPVVAAAASAEDCHSYSLSFGVEENDNSFLENENLFKNQSTAGIGSQSGAGCVKDTSQDMDTNHEDLPMSVNVKCRSLRKSLMPNKQIPKIIVTSPMNNTAEELLNKDDGFCVENQLSLSSQKTFNDKRVLDWINLIDNHPNLEKSKVSSDNENIGLIDNASSSTFKTCESGSSTADILNIGASGSLLQASSSVSSTETCVSECFLYTDEENGIVLLEERWRSNPVLQSDAAQKDQSCSSGGVATTDTETCDTESLRRELTRKGIFYGPITATTKRVYKKRLGSKRKFHGPSSKEESKFSLELQRSLRDRRNLFFVSLGSKLEKQVAEQFSMSEGGDGKRRWREGCSKTSFNYLLLDPRVTRNLPWRAPELAPEMVWAIFLKSIFYVGKGKRSRPYSHLYEAIQHWNNRHPSRFINRKVKQIVDIWAEGFGVVCLHIFQNVIPVEAYTREAAMIDALGLDNLSNAKRSEYYGNAAQWISREQRILGVYLLKKAMTIFLAEGERQIWPWDLNS